MLSRPKSICESTKNILSHLGTGLKDTGSIYGITNGLLKFFFDIFLEDEIGASTTNRLIFGVVLFGLIGGLSVRSFRMSKAEEIREVGKERNSSSEDASSIKLAVTKPLQEEQSITKSDTSDTMSFPLLKV